MPASFSRKTTAAISHLPLQMTTASRVNQTFLLPDGRRLGYAEYGDPKGTPLLYFHGYPSCRLEAFPAHAMCLKHNIRLVSVERPGFGLSTAQPGRKMIDWPKDVQAFADGINLFRFAVIGTSGGGPYALACAHSLPSTMLTGVGMFASGPPWAAGAHYNETYRRIARWMSIYCPTVLRLVFATFVRSTIWICNTNWASRKIEAWLVSEDEKKAKKDDAEPEQKEKKTPAERRVELLHSLVEEPFRQGAAAAVEEARLLSDYDWGFRFEDVWCEKLKIWHGAKDANAPVEMIRWMVERLPRCEYKEFEGDTHYTMHKHFEGALLDLVGSDRKGRGDVAESA